MNPDTLQSLDSRREIALPGTSQATITFCLKHLVARASEAIQARGHFIIALSGGSTPKQIYQALASPAFRDQIDWPRVLVFWSDERAVAPTNPESNYQMAMEAGLAHLPIPTEQIFRMRAEEEIAENARQYERLIATHVPDQVFDLVMLGMGDDGHTASLFPYTHGLTARDRQVIANYIPEKKCWRMTFTFELINRARCAALYVLGESKAARLAEVLLGPSDPMRLPAQLVGTETHKSLWIADTGAAKFLNEKLPKTIC